MNFKSPRDPNTQSIMVKVRDVHPHEGRLCQCGSGECSSLAVESLDNGEGGEYFVCEDHAKEAYALGRLIAEMTNDQVAQFESAIKKAESADK